MKPPYVGPPYGKRDPYYSHMVRDSYGNSMGKGSHVLEMYLRDHLTHRIHGTGIFAYICYKKSTIHVGKYTSPMDPMGHDLDPWLIQPW